MKKTNFLHSFFSEKYRFFSSFCLMILFNVSFIILLSLSKNDIFHAQKYTQTSSINQVLMQDFIEFELKDLFFEATKDDIIELIEKKEPVKETSIVKLIEKKEPIKDDITPIEEEKEQAVELVQIIEPKENQISIEDQNIHEETNVPYNKSVQSLDKDSKQSYIDKVAYKITQNKYYPKAEQNRGRQGIVTVHFSITPKGTIHSLIVQSGSKYKNLNNAALETVKRSAPFASFDATEDLEITLAIDFILQ